MTNYFRAGLLVSPFFLLMSHNPLWADDESGEDMYESDVQEHVQVTRRAPISVTLILLQP